MLDAEPTVLKRWTTGFAALNPACFALDSWDNTQLPQHHASKLQGHMREKRVMSIRSKDRSTTENFSSAHRLLGVSRFACDVPLADVGSRNQCAVYPETCPIRRRAPCDAHHPAIVTSSCRKTLPASPRHELPLSSRSRNITFCPWVGFHYSEKTLRLDAARCTSERYRRPDPLHAIKGTQPWQRPSTTPACKTHPSGPLFCAVPDEGSGIGCVC